MAKSKKTKVAAKEKTKAAVQGSSSDKSNEKLCAILSYLFIGIIWYFADEKMRKSEFAKYHAKQGLVLFITDLVIWVVSGIPIIGWVTAPILWLVFIVILIIGIVNAANENMKPLPIIGKFAENFKF